MDSMGNRELAVLVRLAKGHTHRSLGQRPRNGNAHTNHLAKGHIQPDGGGR
jgi:hypothetical protein